MTPLTDVEIERQHIMALLTPMSTRDPPPRQVPALMVRHQVLPRRLHQLRSLRRLHDAQPNVPIHHGDGPVEQPVLVPLGAVTRLPHGCTDIAELGTAPTG